MAGAPTVRLLGIRHHGPGSARGVESALRSAPPDIVLIEGPADAAGVLALAVHAEMQPPVALLAYAVERPEIATFHPFARFSPEWVALTWALGAGVPVRFVDLPASHALAATVDPEQLVVQPSPGGHPERPMDPLAELAAAAGYDDAERWWEDVVEHRSHGRADGGGELDAPFPAVAEAMRALRAEHRPGGEPSDIVEQRREAHMRAGIRAASREGFVDIAVVCGAWHVPALESALDPARARRDTVVLRGMPKLKSAVTWVPWTNRRLASGSGYRAGVTAPGWYHHLYTCPGPEVIARWFTESAQLLRVADHPASAADVVEATRLADAIAALRGRPLAGLAEVDDAALAVFGRGGDAALRLVREAQVIGTQIGAVPLVTPMVPLARSLVAEQRRCRLKPDATTRVLELDLRAPLGLRRSELLHRLALLGVAWGVETEGRGSAGTFRETWSLRWEPELEVRLIEAAGLGTTVASAATAAVLNRARHAIGLGELTVLLERCLLARLDAAVPDIIAMVSERSAVAVEVGRLLEAIPPLARTLRYGDVRGRSSLAGSPSEPAGPPAGAPDPRRHDVEAMLDAVVGGLVGRVAVGLAVACAGIDDDASAAIAQQVRDAQAALALLGRDDLRATFHDGLGELLDHPRVNGLLRGLAARLLTDAAVLSPAASERCVSLALSPGNAPADAAAFVEGFLASSGTALVHDQVLLGVIDGWLSTLAADSFVAVVALLRRTFGAFEPAERRAIGVRLRSGGAPDSARGPVPLDPERVAAALHTVALLLGVPT